MAVGERGFTLLELMVAVTVMSLLSLATYGVVAMGARAAGSGERTSEQTRRFRIATEVVVRQLRSAAPIMVLFDEDQGEKSAPEPYFWGRADSLDFITASPQRSDTSGLGVVRYWYEDGAVMMSEMPLFAAGFQDPFAPEAEELTITTTLLYDVASLNFQYRRTPHRKEEWEDQWDASEEESLPAVVLVEVRPDTVDGPRWTHEVPLFVGVLNEISGEDDFRGQRVATAARIKRSSKQAQDEGDDDPDDEDDEDDE